MNKKEKKIITKINLELNRCVQLYIGELIAPSTMQSMAVSFSNAVEKYSAGWYNEFCDHVKLNVDERDPYTVLITPKKNAPLWVIELLYKIKDIREL